MTTLTQDHLDGGYGHRGLAVSDLPYSSQYSYDSVMCSFSISSLTLLFLIALLKQMVDVAAEGGGISGDAYAGEGHWGEGLELANGVGSGVVAVSLSLL